MHKHQGKFYSFVMAMLLLLKIAGAQVVAVPPVISPATGSYSGSVKVTITDATAGAEIHYTTDGSQPDYTSPLYTGPLTLVNGTFVVHAIAGVAPVKQLQYQNKQALWKKADCAAPGMVNCTSDDPGGPGIPSVVENSIGVAGIGSLFADAKCKGTTPCMALSMTPSKAHTQTNVLWARTGAGCDKCTWLVSTVSVFYPKGNGTNVTAYEHDLQNFDPTDHINYQFGMQCLACTTEKASWMFGGTANTHWLDSGITTPFAEGVWHTIVREDRIKPLEVITRPCSANGKAYPCQYYWKLILDGTAYNLQDLKMCPQRAAGSGQQIGTTGCTITTAALNQGWGSNTTDQYQLDTNQAGPSLAPVGMLVDNASFEAYYDPSVVATATYTFDPNPTPPPPPVITAPATITCAEGTAPAVINGYTITCPAAPKAPAPKLNQKVGRDTGAMRIPDCKITGSGEDSILQCPDGPVKISNLVIE